MLRRSWQRWELPGRAVRGLCLCLQEAAGLQRQATAMAGESFNVAVLGMAAAPLSPCCG